MQHFIQVPRLSYEVGRLVKLMRMGGKGGAGVAYKQGCLKSSGTLPKFSSANFFSANWVDG